MSASHALSYLRGRGIGVELDDGDLILSRADGLPAKAIERLREMKAEIVTLLKNEARFRPEQIDLLARTAAIRPAGYSDQEWLAALADARRLGYGLH